MNRTARTIVVLGLVFFAPRAHGQDSSKDSDPVAVRIISQSLRQMGADQLRQFRDTHASMKVTTMRASGVDTKTAEIKTLGNESLRIDPGTTDATDRFVVVTKRGAMAKTSDREEIVPARAFGSVAFFHLPLAALRDCADPDLGRLTYVALIDQNGRKLHHLRWRSHLSPGGVRDTDDAPIDIFVDAQSLLVSRLAFARHAPSNLKSQVKVAMEYSDYRAVQGILIPFEITYLIRDRQWQRYSVTDFKVNQGVPASQFEVRQP